MWSFLSKGLSKELSKYDIGEIKYQPDENCFWTIHKGKIKATGEEVSVFVLEFKGHSDNEIKAAKNAYKRIKTLRHPGILNFLDGCESESCIYIITPVVDKLTNALFNEFPMRKDDNKSQFSANDWGMFKLANLLTFLNIDCRLVHNNIGPHAIYIDKGGEWKLFGLEYSFNFGDEDRIKITCLKPKCLRKYEPPECTAGYGMVDKSAEPWSIDIWGFACLIWEIFNGELTQKSMLKQTSKLPKESVSLYCEMMNSNPSARLSPAKFLEKSRSTKNGYLNNPCLSAMIFLDEIQMKDSAEKKKFFTSTLPPLLDSFSADICKHKILPQVVQAFEYCEAGTAIIPALIKLGNAISDDPVSYDKLIRPCLVKLYSLPDRHTRIALLDALPQYHKCLSPNVVNDQLFNYIVTGFLDTNPLVKEATIKGMVYLAPKLNYNNLNIELVKYFARLQGTDPHGGIRTNTTVCMGRISKYFDPKIRQKILISAFTRPFRDAFLSCRKAGLQALAATADLYLIKDIAEKILPTLCMLTIDPDKSIRDMAFEVFDGFVQTLKDVSEHPEKVTEHDNFAMSSKLADDQFNATSALGNTMQNAYKIGEASKVALGWVSTLTSKLYYGGPQSPNATVNPQNANGETNDAVLDDLSGNISTGTQLSHTSNKISHGNSQTSKTISANGNSYDAQNHSKTPEQEEFNDDDEAWEGLEDINLNSKTESFFSAYTQRYGDADDSKNQQANEDFTTEEDWWKTDDRGNKGTKQSTKLGIKTSKNTSNKLHSSRVNTKDSVLDDIIREEEMATKNKTASSNLNSRKLGSQKATKTTEDPWENWGN